jgi:2-aminobenzoate-CoA ligase
VVIIGTKFHLKVLMTPHSSLREYYHVPGAEAELIFALPELHYPPALNASFELIWRPVRSGYGGKVAYIEAESGHTTTYRELYVRVAQLMRWLSMNGVVPADRVALRLPDSVDYVAMLLAIFGIGAVGVPTSPRLTGDDLSYILSDAEAKVVITTGELVSVAEEAARKANRAGSVLTLPPSELNANAESAPFYQTMADDLALLLYTSGTTGRPKGTCHSHRDIVAEADSYCRYCLRPGPAEVFAGISPMCYAYGFDIYVSYTLRSVSSAVIVSHRDPAHLVSAMMRYGVTIFGGVPTFYNQVLQAESAVDLRRSSVRSWLCGGEPLSLQTWDEWLERTGQPLMEHFGSTEMLTIFSAYRWGIDTVRRGWVGRMVPGYAGVIRDLETFKPVGPNAEGILTLRGPTSTKYWKAPDAQRAAVKQGWNVCKDIMIMDEDGHLQWRARVDDVIMSGAYKIPPAAVEQILSQHPAVADVACVGVEDPDGLRSQVVKAYIALKPGLTPSPELARELQRFVKEKAQPHMYPRLVEFVESFPRTETGKIRRQELYRRSPPRSES